MSLAAYGAVAHGGVEYGISARSRVAAGASYVDPSVPLGSGTAWAASTSESKGRDDDAGAGRRRDGRDTDEEEGTDSVKLGGTSTMPAAAAAAADEEEALLDAIGMLSPTSPGGYVPFSTPIDAASAGGGGGGRSAPAPRETPFERDDEPRDAGEHAEADDVETQEAVRRLAAEVRFLQLQTQERRMLAQVMQLAAAEAAAAAERRRAVAIDELRTQNALLASVVEQARAARDDLLGVTGSGAGGSAEGGGRGSLQSPAGASSAAGEVGVMGDAQSDKTG
jgi:hypothetical protein